MMSTNREETNAMIAETSNLLRNRDFDVASIAPITREEKLQKSKLAKEAAKKMMDEHYDRIGLGSSNVVATLFNQMPARPKKIALHISGGDAKEPPMINDMSQDDLAGLIKGARIAIGELERLSLLASRFHALRSNQSA
jgi:hypothetical protein